MLEKNSTVLLTPEDLKLYQAGRVSERLAEEWGMTLDKLKEIVENQRFVTTEEA